MASLARTILEEHLERGELVPGQEIALRVDQALAQDATGTMAMMQFELFGEERVRVDTAVVYVDHNILQIDFKNQTTTASYRRWPPSTARGSRGPATESATTFTASDSQSRDRRSSART